MIRIGIFGYGNLGKGVECAVAKNPDMELVGVFTRRDPASVKTVSGIPVYSAEKNQVMVTIKLDSGSYLGAGDFVLNFNTEYFTYNSATNGFVPTFFTINDKIKINLIKVLIIKIKNFIKNC